MSTACVNFQMLEITCCTCQQWYHSRVFKRPTNCHKEMLAMFKVKALTGELELGSSMIIHSVN